MYHRVFSTHLEQVVLAVHTAQLIVNGGYKKSEPKRLAGSDEFELKFPELSRSKKFPSRVEPSWTLQFSSWIFSNFNTFFKTICIVLVSNYFFFGLF